MTAKSVLSISALLSRVVWNSRCVVPLILALSDLAPGTLTPPVPLPQQRECGLSVPRRFKQRHPGPTQSTILTQGTTGNILLVTNYSDLYYSIMESLVL